MILYFVGEEETKDEDTVKSENVSEEKAKFELQDNIVKVQSSAVQRLADRRAILQNIGSFRRGLCARKDLDIRRQLCKLDKVKSGNKSQFLKSFTLLYIKQSFNVFVTLTLQKLQSNLYKGHIRERSKVAFIEGWLLHRDSFCRNTEKLGI